MKFEDSLASDDPFAFIADPFAFLKLIGVLEDGYFLLLLPAGGNRVNLVHSCFKATAVDTAGGSSVFYFRILGSRRSSSFKRINIGQAVMHQACYPRVARLEERKETLAPSMKDFAKCKIADKFRDSVADPRRKRILKQSSWKTLACQLRTKRPIP